MNQPEYNTTSSVHPGCRRSLRLRRRAGQKQAPPNHHSSERKHTTPRGRGLPVSPASESPQQLYVVCSPQVLAEKEETEVVRKYGTGLGECEKTKEERKREKQTESFRGCTQQRETPVQTGVRSAHQWLQLWLQLVASLYTSATPALVPLLRSSFLGSFGSELWSRAPVSLYRA